MTQVDGHARVPTTKFPLTESPNLQEKKRLKRQLWMERGEEEFFYFFFFTNGRKNKRQKNEAHIIISYICTVP